MGQGDRGTRRQGDKETGGQGDKETGGQGERNSQFVSGSDDPS